MTYMLFIGPGGGVYSRPQMLVFDEDPFPVVDAPPYRFDNWADLMAAVAPLAAAKAHFSILFGGDFAISTSVPAGDYDFGGNCDWLTASQFNGDFGTTSMQITFEEGVRIRGVRSISGLTLTSIATASVPFIYDAAETGAPATFGLRLVNCVLQAQSSDGNRRELISVRNGATLGLYSDGTFYRMMGVPNPTSLFTVEDISIVNLVIFGSDNIMGDTFTDDGGGSSQLTVRICTQSMYSLAPQTGIGIQTLFVANGVDRFAARFGCTEVPIGGATYQLRLNGGDDIADATGASWFPSSSGNLERPLTRVVYYHRTGGAGPDPLTVQVVANGATVASFPADPVNTPFYTQYQFPDLSGIVQDGTEVRVELIVPASLVTSPQGIFVDIFWA